jgi:hypothetical protein
MKIGKGRILKCYKKRMTKTYISIDDREIKCLCGNIIGYNEDTFIRMKQNNFIFTGTYN